MTPYNKVESATKAICEAVVNEGSPLSEQRHARADAAEVLVTLLREVGEYVVDVNGRMVFVVMQDDLRAIASALLDN